MMNLHEFHPAAGSTKWPSARAEDMVPATENRRARHKGQKARSGGGVRPEPEGGQMP